MDYHHLFTNENFYNLYILNEKQSYVVLFTVFIKATVAPHLYKLVHVKVISGKEVEEYDT